MTAEEKYSLCNSENFRQPIQMELSKTLTAFSQYFSQFMESASNFKHLGNKITLVAYIFSLLQAMKCMIRPTSNEPHFIVRFSGQDVKEYQTFVKSASQYFYQIFLSLSGKLIWKTTVLVIFEIFRLFVKTLTADDKYSLSYI